MLMNLLLNSLWQVTDNELLASADYRLLALNANIDSCILIKKPKGREITRPFLFPIAALQTLIEQKHATKRNDERTELTEKEIPSKWKAKRDRNYESIKDIVCDPSSLLTIACHKRTTLIKDHVAQANTPALTTNKVYRLLCLYWTKGANRNALLPEYHKLGLTPEDDKQRRKVSGRKHQISVHGQLPQGRIFDKSDRSNAIQLIQRRKLKQHSTFKMVDLYHEFIDLHFLEELLVAEKDRRPPNIPTKRQFAYFVNKQLCQNDKTLLAKGESYYQGNVKQVEKDSTSELWGPGSVFQLDATTADVHLLSPKTKQPIGRPTIYCIVDVFSRLIVSVYIGTKPPSWETAKTAIWYCTASNKQLIEDCGLTYSPEEWPCQGYPKTLVVDRGEMIGVKPSMSLPELGINIRITPPYRGHMKAIVERRFGIFNQEIHKLSGTTQGKQKQRDQKDPKLSATLTLGDFSKILLTEVIAHNHSIFDALHSDVFYQRDLAPTPLNCWRHFVEEEQQHELRYIEKEQLFASLLSDVTRFHATRLGLVVKGLTYSSDAYRQLMNKSSLKLPQSAKVKIHQEESSYVYFKHSIHEPYLRLTLIQQEAKYAHSQPVEITNMKHWLEGKKREPSYLVSQSQKRLGNIETARNAKNRLKKKKLSMREQRSLEPNVMEFDKERAYREASEPTPTASSLDDQSTDFFTDIEDSWDD